MWRELPREDPLVLHRQELDRRERMDELAVSVALYSPLERGVMGVPVDPPASATGGNR